MSKKDFIVVANMLIGIRWAYVGASRAGTFYSANADILKNKYTKFNKEKFVAFCLKQDGEGV